MQRNGREASWAWQRAAPRLLAAVVFFGERPSRAEEPPALAVRITESFHDGCPKRPSMRERIEAHLGRLREAGPDELAVDLAFDIKRQGAMSHGTLTLSLSGASVERNASAKSCADVVAALSMMAAIALSSDASEERIAPPATEPTPPSPGQEATAPATPEAALPFSVRSGHATARQRPSQYGNHVTLSFGTGIEVDANRGAVLAPSWFAQLTLPTSLTPTLRIGLARTLGERAASAGGEATIRWTELTLMGCVDLLRTEQLRFGPCVNSELGSLEATKVDPLPARKLAYFWPSLGASGRLTWRVVPGFSVDLMVGARAPLIARELFFEPDRESAVYRTPALVPFIGIGFVARVL